MYFYILSLCRTSAQLLNSSVRPMFYFFNFIIWNGFYAVTGHRHTGLAASSWNNPGVSWMRCLDDNMYFFKSCKCCGALMFTLMHCYTTEISLLSGRWPQASLMTTLPQSILNKKRPRTADHCSGNWLSGCCLMQALNNLVTLSIQNVKEFPASIIRMLPLSKAFKLQLFCLWFSFADFFLSFWRTVRERI